MNAKLCWSETQIQLLLLKGQIYLFFSPSSNVICSSCYTFWSHKTKLLSVIKMCKWGYTLQYFGAASITYMYGKWTRYRTFGLFWWILYLKMSRFLLFHFLFKASKGWIWFTLCNRVWVFVLKGNTWGSAFFQDNGLSKELIERQRANQGRRRILLKGLVCVSVNELQNLSFNAYSLTSLSSATSPFSVLSWFYIYVWVCIT